MNKNMINKIKKIKNLVVFSNYQWDNSLPEFKRYNLIYGWNRSGKTTLSNLFSALETGSLSEYPLLEYELETEVGIYKQNQPFNRSVKVFNQNYVVNNIELGYCKAKSILILGEENKAIAQQIEEDEKILNGDPSKPDNIGKIEKQEEKKLQQQRAEKEKDRIFSDIAKIIGANTSGVTTRNYRKPNAESAFNTLTKKELLEDEIRQTYVITLKQEEKPVMAELAVPMVNNEDVFSAFERLLIAGKSLCERTVESVVIERLKDKQNISEWVEKGLSLHKHYKSIVCEFCGQPLSEKRINELVSYFNEADQKLKMEIDALLTSLQNVYTHIESIKPVEKANLYTELQSKYQSAVNDLELAIIRLLEMVFTIDESLKNKKLKATESVSLMIDLNVASIRQNLVKVNESILAHSTKTKNFQAEKKEAQEKLEKHYLSEIYDEVIKIENTIEECKNEIKKFEDGDADNPTDLGIKSLKNRISENRSKISSSHKGCDKINDRLKTFLGSNEIVFEVAEEGGYLIKRNSNIAKNLSEGEKTAIALTHFIIRLQEETFNLKEGIIVVDDPISSLDSNSLFQAFSFIKNAVKDAHQVYILTHNFDFLRLLLNWINHSKQPHSYFMIKNKYSTIDGREVYIAKLDKTLVDHESEYHYLMKTLFEFVAQGENAVDIASVYHIPNIVRKALDTFLMFRVPNSNTLYNKIESLSFNEDKKLALYKFANDQSHITGKGFDPALVPEAQKNVKYLLEMIEAVFPEHYSILKESFELPTN